MVRIEARDHALRPAPWERYAIALEDSGQHAWNGCVCVTVMANGTIQARSVPANIQELYYELNELFSPSIGKGWVRHAEEGYGISLIELAEMVFDDVLVKPRSRASPYP